MLDTPRFVFEGQDLAGKSTQIKRVAEYLTEIGVANTTTAEPGGTPANMKIRAIMKDDSLKLSGVENILLVTAARVNSNRMIIVPNRENGVVVLQDRCHDSTIAYQHYGQQAMSIEEIEEMTHKYVGEEYMNPSLEIILALDDQERKKRKIERGNVQEAVDPFEKDENQLQSRIAQGYIDLAKRKGLPVIDAGGTEEEVTKKILHYVQPIIDEFLEQKYKLAHEL